MVRLSEISYAIQPFEKQTPESIVKYVQRHCAPWLTASGGKYAYRGSVQVQPPSYFIRNTRTERRPMNSPRRIHDMFNTIIDNAGGIANRSNSLFVSGSKRTAEEYGSAFIVFPIGNFNYTWSPYWKDWYMSSHTIETLWVTGKLADKIRIDQGLDFVLGTGYEVMVSCESALYVDPVSFYEEWPA